MSERSEQENFRGDEKKNHIMQILDPEMGGELYMRPLDQNLGDASPPTDGGPPSLL